MQSSQLTTMLFMTIYSNNLTGLGRHYISEETAAIKQISTDLVIAK